MPSFRVPDSYSSSPPSTPDRRRDGAFNPFSASNPSTTPAGPPPSSAGSFTPAGPPPSSILGSSRLSFQDSNQPLQPPNFGKLPSPHQFNSSDASQAFGLFGQTVGNKPSGLSNEFKAPMFRPEKDGGYTHEGLDQGNSPVEYEFNESRDAFIGDIERAADEMEEDRYGYDQDFPRFDNSLPGGEVRNTDFEQSNFRSSESHGRSRDNEVANFSLSAANIPGDFMYARAAKDISTQLGTPQIDEEDDLVLRTEALIGRLYQEGINEDEQAHIEVTTIIPGDLVQLWSEYDQRTKPHQTTEYATAIGPGPRSSGFARAYFLASLLLSLHHPSEVGSKPPWAMLERRPVAQSALGPLKSVPEVLMEWIADHHDPYPDQLALVMTSRPSPTHNRLFWNTMLNSLLRGRVLGVVSTLRDAGWDHARQAVDDTRNPNSAGYSGKALINVEKVAGEMLQILQGCPAMRGDWDTTNSDWTLFRLKASQGLENLKRFAEGKDQPDEEPPAFEASNFGMFSMEKSYSGAARRAESRVPWEVYQNFTAMYNLVLGDVTSIIESSQDWCEATIGLMIWWSQANHGHRFAPGRSHTSRNRTEPRSPFKMLKEAFHLATGPSTDFNVNPLDTVEVGVASIFESDVRSALAIIGTLSCPVSSAVAEVASVAGWLPPVTVHSNVGMSDSLDQDDMDVLGLDRIPPQQPEDDKTALLVAYADALSERRTFQYTPKTGPKIAREGWEVAIEVLARLDSAERSEKEVGRLISDLSLKDGPTVDKLWRLLNDLAMTDHSEHVAEQYATFLSDHTHKYGEAVWYFALAHKQSKVKDVLDLLISLSLLHSVAYPPEDELDDHLQRLISSPKTTLAEISRLDYEAAKLIHKMLSGYATLRQFYTLRDEVRYSSGQKKPLSLATKLQAASALVTVITSSDDSIRGGLYDEERDAVVSVDFLLALLGESMVFINQPQRLITPTQIYVLLKAIEDLQTVPDRVYSACDEFFQTVVASTQGLKGSTPMDLLKKSTSSMSGTSSFAMVSSSIIASQLKRSISASGVLMKENVHRGWDWRRGLTSGMTSADVLRILRYGLAKELARACILEADGHL